jgi:two-component system OmpR family sensor kinase
MLSIRWRLTLFNAAVILLIAGVLIGILGIVAYRGVRTSVEETARARANEIVRFLEAGNLADADLTPFTEGTVFLVIRDASGAVVAQAGSPSPGLDAVSGEERTDIWQDVLVTGEPVARTPDELYVFALPVDDGPSRARVVEAWKSYDETGQNIIPFVAVVTFGVPLGLLLAIAGSYLLARSALAPVSAIRRTAQEISDRDLSRRLPVARSHDELGQLAATFNDLLERLDIAFRQREELLARQRRFVADASHELRTPLTSIRGYARMLRQWALDDPEKARESVEAIEREAARMSELVEGLLRLARGDESAPLSLETGDLRDVAGAAVAAASAVANGQIDVRYQPPDAPVRATFDSEAIRQLLDILLENALRHTPASGAITVETRTDGGQMLLTVRDTGPGIAPEHLPHLFERFYQIDPARNAGGSGLGLAIAQQIAEQHGGMLTVDSRVGEGTTFMLRLPARSPGSVTGAVRYPLT